ncbi:MAG: hypothetical protein CVV10_07875 [Gammaproteobacteria bacterium HGW-Gammaproteobacteria-14]|nr:MAG: hypothetical protein CVV10_07875 [Gammaproteobacteria bacterium HGW-Gammaproteobacteria-14]
MNKYIVLISIAVFFVALIYVSEVSDIKPDDITEQASISSITLDATISHNAAAVVSLEADRTPSDTVHQNARPEIAKISDNPMQNQLADVAEAYRYSARFPPYSQPLTENDWTALNPRAFSPSEKPLSNAPSLKVSIELPQYVLDRSHDLPVKVVVANEGDSTSTLRVTGGQVAIRHSAGRGSPMPLESTTLQGNVETFLAMIPASELASLPDTEVTVTAQLKLSDGESSVVTAVARLYESVANLNYLGSAYVDGAHLVIPAHFDVTQSGYYRVQANLFSETGVPVSHLNAAFMLSGDNAVGLMKVHAVTLREKDIAGPYVFRDINVMRMPSGPGEQTQYGSASATSYPVAAFPLTMYNDEAYEDPATQQRIKFLEALSGAEL